MTEDTRNCVDYETLTPAAKDCISIYFQGWDGPRTDWFELICADSVCPDRQEFFAGRGARYERLEAGWAKHSSNPYRTSKPRADRAQSAADFAAVAAFMLAILENRTINW